MVHWKLLLFFFSFVPTCILAANCVFSESLTQSASHANCGSVASPLVLLFRTVSPSVSLLIQSSMIANITVDANTTGLTMRLIDCYLGTVYFPAYTVQNRFNLDIDRSVAVCGMFSIFPGSNRASASDVAAAARRGQYPTQLIQRTGQYVHCSVMTAFGPFSALSSAFTMRRSLVNFTASESSVFSFVSRGMSIDYQMFGSYPGDQFSQFQGLEIGVTDSTIFLWARVSGVATDVYSAFVVNLFEGVYRDIRIEVSRCNTTLLSETYTFYAPVNQLVGLSGRTIGSNATILVSEIDHVSQGWRLSLVFWALDTKSTCWWQGLQIKVRQCSFAGAPTSFLHNVTPPQQSNILVVRLHQEGRQLLFLPNDVSVVVEDVAVDASHFLVTDTKVVVSQLSGNLSAVLTRCSVTPALFARASFADIRPRQQASCQLVASGLELKATSLALPSLFTIGDVNGLPSIFSSVNLTFYDLSDLFVPALFLTVVNSAIAHMSLNFYGVSISATGLVTVKQTFIATSLSFTVQSSTIAGILYFEESCCLVARREVLLKNVHYSTTVAGLSPVILFDASRENCEAMENITSRFAVTITNDLLQRNVTTSYCVDDHYRVVDVTVVDNLTAQPTFLIRDVAPRGQRGELLTLPLCVASSSDPSRFSFAGTFLSSMPLNWTSPTEPLTCTPVDVVCCSSLPTKTATIEESTLRFYSNDKLSYPAAVTAGFTQHFSLGVVSSQITLKSVGSGSSLLWATEVIQNVTVYVGQQSNLYFQGPSTSLVNISTVRGLTLTCLEGTTLSFEALATRTPAGVMALNASQSWEDTLITLTNCTIVLQIPVTPRTDVQGALIDLRSGSLVNVTVLIIDSEVVLSKCKSENNCGRVPSVSLIQLGGDSADVAALSVKTSSIVVCNSSIQQHIVAGSVAVIQTGYTTSVPDSRLPFTAQLIGLHISSSATSPVASWELVRVMPQYVDVNVTSFSPNSLTALSIRVANNAFMSATARPLISRCVTTEPFHDRTFLVPSGRVETGCNFFFSVRPVDCQLYGKLSSLAAQVDALCGSFTEPLTLTLTKEQTVSESCPLPEVVRVLSRTNGASLVSFYNGGFTIQLQLNTELRVEGYERQGFEPTTERIPPNDPPSSSSSSWSTSRSEVLSRYFAINRARIQKAVVQPDTRGDYTVLSVQISTVSPVLLSNDIEVELQILPMAFQCFVNDETTLRHRVTFRGRESIVPQEVQDAAGLSSVITNTVASMSSSTMFPSTATSATMWRSALILSLSTCAFSDTSPMALGDSPTQMAIPGSRPEGMYYRGAVVGGLLLVYGFLLLLAFRGVLLSLWVLSGTVTSRRSVRGAWSVAARCWSADRSHQERRQLWNTVKKSLIVVQMPGAATGLLFSVGPGVLSAATSLLAPMGGDEELSPTPVDVVISLVGFGGVFLLIGLFILRIVVKFPCVPRRQRMPKDLPSLYSRLTFRWVKWTRSPAFREQYGALFESYHHQNWAILDIALCALLGILAGVRPRTEAGCNILLVVVTGLCLLSSGIVIWKRPFATRLDNAILVVTSGCQAASGVLVLLSVFDSSRDEEDDSALTDAADILATFLFAVNSASILLELIPLIVGRVRTLCFQKENHSNGRGEGDSSSTDEPASEKRTVRRHASTVSRATEALAVLQPKLQSLCRLSSSSPPSVALDNLEVLVSYICHSRLILQQSKGSK